MLEQLRALCDPADPDSLLMLAAYSDNVYLATLTPSTVLPAALAIIDESHGRPAGYERGTTTLCMPGFDYRDDADAMDVDEGFHPRRDLGIAPVREFVAVGVPIGSEEFVNEFLEAKRQKLEALFNEIDALDDAQVQLYLIARSMSVCRVTMRCLPPSPTAPILGGVLGSIAFVTY